MKNKKLQKIMTGIVLAIVMISISLNVFAAPNPKDIQEITTETSGITELGGKLIGILSTIGSVVSVLVLIVLGIKYMMGSAEEKAEYKKTLLPYIIGAALVFAASTIAGVVFNFANSI